MAPFVLILGGGAAIALALLSRKANAAEQEEITVQEQADIFERIGGIRNVDPDLLRAIAYVESSMRADAVRWNPPNDVSVGLMQILCTPPAGVSQGQDYVCQNRFDFADQWPTTYTALFDSELNVDIGAQILAYNIRKFGPGIWRGVAVYNNYAARHASPNGPFPNDLYVNRVKARFNFLKGISA